MANPQPDHLFKLVIIGDAGVGKSSLLLRFTEDNFSTNYISTIGVDFRFRTLNIKQKIVKLQIWDTAGQERFRTITSAYYRGADGVILVYDVTSSDSFKHVEDWLEQVNKYASEDTAKLIVGNKADLIKDKKVSSDEALDFGKKFGIDVVETSAKTATNVDVAFNRLGEQLIETRGSNSEKKRDAGRVKLKHVKTGGSRKCCK
mmetsp:Transcript_23259/g.32521  ORF Transcript_23259/g.32521 Transcript_23259/m.32521 type:complete len:203 (-) Transcript_23259:414-1022(-)|eukprot:CAMPEP_0185263842 /NCGR_PEP_ID=MMETSP1359-20130426/16905_1 /TAXON_ID=552665 /ORGANISM="Bigelowiella longifila, Strain CCMP242" /LENGTH=202 /DNA_ID=CAMNT_0027851693 /DNA_START=58 /DNA_END=666 /DNA_ORIENTATION=-